MIFVIDDNEVMAECIANACGCSTRIFSNAIEAMAALDDELPELIFLDILLIGPDGFTFLNELASYADTAKIPVVVVSSLDFSGKDLSEYGVVGVLSKDDMTPNDIRGYADKYVSEAKN